ncbi:MAG: methylmalonyl Co-A mutase-associated GTPase MeaB [Bacteriovoracaceae bacterium]|nr:methylmalonyl Co-A mutase-associated GTPase MeaB [Bacteriovoracaceae bacterium]
MRKNLELKDYVAGIKAGDIAILSRAITLVESKRAEHQKLARELIQEIMPLTGKSHRIGISGSPGVGKSSFIETFGKYLTSKGLKLAVLAIDPSSQITGGSILGDKTRMAELSIDPNCFIRPSPSGKSLGGVAAKTWESLLLCEAFGFDVVLVETVGVGQSETTVARLVDFFLLLMQPGGGDDLQGIKRGIMEIADLICVNKADGENMNQAKLAKRNYENAVHILRVDSMPKVMLCSAIKKTGLEDIWNEIESFYIKQKGALEKKRAKNLGLWIKDMILEKIQNDFESDDLIKIAMEENHQKVLNQQKNILEAVDELYLKFKGKK